jgi:CheY-like chemotaxis protein
LNLIVNAAQAIPEGHADQNEVRVTTRMIGARVAIEIEDTGPGMPPSVIEKLFTPFFTTKPAGIGTGLGLSICHRIIEELKGQIQVDSQPGKGSTFRVLLPSTPLEPIAVVVPPIAAPTGIRGKLLVVDDEKAVANAIERTLRRDHDVTTTCSAGAALTQLASGKRFDLVLCDLMMPEMTGMQLYAKVLADDPAQAGRFIFLSGGAFTSSARAFLDDVSHHRLEKPFDAQQLRTIVNERIRLLGQFATTSAEVFAPRR